MRISDWSLDVCSSDLVLVNNIGIGAGAGPLHQVAEADIDRVLSVNLGTIYNMCRQTIPALMEGQGKAIVNISSVAGIRAHGNAAYGPSKAAVQQLTAELAVMYGRDGIRANCGAQGQRTEEHTSELQS